LPFIDLPSQAPNFPKDGTYDPVAFDFFQIFTTMAYPRDLAAQQRVTDAVNAGNIAALIREAQEYVDRGKIGGVTVDGKITLFLADAPDMMTELDAATDTSGFGGRLAGMALGYMVFRFERADTRSSASLGAAFRMIEEGCRKGGWRGGSRGHMRQTIWPTFRAAAHLWAAYQFMEGGQLDMGTNLNPTTLRTFLGGAEWFRRKGEALIPLHGNEPVLLAKETWKIPPELMKDWPTIDLREEDLDRWDLRKVVRPHRTKA
jgi:hypothetical protein